MKLVVFVIGLACAAAAPLRTSRKLYDTSDNVEILDTVNFKQKVYNSSHAYLVEFYASWCGDCQHFAPIWRAFAIDIHGWQDLVRLAVLDCSDEDNIEICREFGIVRYPTVRYFHEFSQGLGEFFSDDNKNNTMPKRTLLTRIENELNASRGAFYPDLRPYTGSDLSELFANLPEHIQHGFLYVGRENTSIASEAAMDLHKTNITIRRALAQNTPLVSHLKLTEFPALIIQKRNESDNYKVITGDIKTRRNLNTQIINYLKTQNIKVMIKSFYQKKHNVTDEEKARDKAKADLRARIKRMGDVVFQADLESAIRYSLRHEVATTKVITGEKLDALRAYINVLKKYLPLGLDREEFFEKLLNATQSDQVLGEDIAHIVNNASSNETRVFSTPQIFIGCQGSSPTFRGYPCSMWKLFHFLTVNSVLSNVNNRRAKPGEVLDAMHGYIKNYFGCAACSDHFQQMAKTREIGSVKTLEESILWLWAAHNEVNQRLAGDATEDPEFPKYEFPTKVRCPQCRNGDEWDYKEVLKYLKQMYNSFNVRYIAADTYVLFDGLN